MTGPLSPDLMELVAERFEALSEPARLQILEGLRQGERIENETERRRGVLRGR